MWQRSQQKYSIDKSYTFVCFDDNRNCYHRICWLFGLFLFSGTERTEEQLFDRWGVSSYSVKKAQCDTKRTFSWGRWERINTRNFAKYFHFVVLFWEDWMTVNTHLHAVNSPVLWHICACGTRLLRRHIGTGSLCVLANSKITENARNSISQTRSRLSKMSLLLLLFFYASDSTPQVCSVLVPVKHVCCAAILVQGPLVLWCT